MEKKILTKAVNNDKKMVHDHLYSQNCLLREMAAEFLSKTNSVDVAKGLLAELTNKDRFIASRAAWGLTLMKERISVPLLIKALRSSNPNICREAGWALKRTTSMRADKALSEALKDRNPIVQQSAAFGLCGKAIAKNAKVQRTLIKMLKGDKGNITITLGETKNKKAMDALSAALQTKTFPARAMAIMYLANAKDSRALKPAIDMLKEKDHNSSTAMWSLELLDDTKAIGPVVEHITHLGQNKCFNQLYHPMRTIDRLKRTAAIEFLLPFLYNKDYRVRLNATVSLGAVASKKAAKHLIRMLNDEHWLVRGSAAEALGAIGDVKVLKHLISSLNDRSWYVRRYAAVSIGKLKDPRAVHSLLMACKDKNELVQLAAVEALSEIASPSPIIVTKMIRGLSCDQNPHIRRVSAEFLGKMKVRKAVPVLIKRLLDEQGEERAMFAEALGNIGDRRAIEPLKRCLKDSTAEVYMAAEKALNQINEPKPTIFRHIYGCRIK
ncbi:MAG: HEAT repeat domain-containing protein [Elusimicrobia bacterium]|nr:HEAT repeat domain-containing protein [Elusimicrobiota bacterium]